MAVPKVQTIMIIHPDMQLDVLNGFASEVVISTPLNYLKGFSLFSFQSITGWYPWTDDWNTKIAGNGFGGPTSPIDVLHPEPILADIEFDIDGSMILTLNDRTGLQTGVDNIAPQQNCTDIFTLYDGFVAGDILRAFFSD